VYLQHKLIGFYNRDEKCLQRGTDWVFKYNSLHFVFKGLMEANVIYAFVEIFIIQINCVRNIAFIDTVIPFVIV
jgi:hypothetical protein